MFWVWAWLGLVAGVIALWIVYCFVRANVQRLKMLDAALRAEAESFEIHRKKELWDLEQAKKFSEETE